MLPLFDENPTTRRPVVTVALLLVCLGAYLAPGIGGGADPVTVPSTTPPSMTPPSNGGQVDSTPTTLPAEVGFPLRRAAVPCEIIQRRPLTVDEVVATYVEPGSPTACDPDDDGPALFPAKRVRLAVLSSLFLHDGVLHLGVNLLFLWVFGNNVEQRLHHLGFLAFYLVGGIVATMAYLVAQPSGTVALLGASGAVAGVMGAYLVWYPDAPIRTLVFLVLVDIRARWFLALWFVVQFFTAGGPLGWTTHVAGFAYGIIVGSILRRTLPRLRFWTGQGAPRWDGTGGAGHGPYPHLDEVWVEPHHDRYRRPR